MMSLNRFAQAGCLASYLLLLSACNSPDTSVTAAQDPNQGGKEPEIVFSETFSDSGRFTITKDPELGLAYNVQARIGSDAEKLLEISSTQTTMAEVYRTLHGGQGELPAVVIDVSAKLESQRSATVRPERPAQGAGALGKASSFSDFSNTYCKDIREGSYIWKFEGCFWGANEHYYLTPWVDPGDRVYAWNVSPYTATMSLWNQGLATQPNTWRPTLQPYWVTWFQWGGTYSYAYAKMELPAGRTGELGLVVHYPVAVPVR